MTSCNVDDVTFVTKSAKANQACDYMQIILKHAEKWFTNNQLTISSNKFTAIVISSRFQVTPSSLTINDELM